MRAYATTDRTGFRHYTSDPVICRDCPLLASCTTSANATRLITRHVWQDHRERAAANRLTQWGKAIYRRRKETVERSFADAKQIHGHRYARFRSLVRVRVQCLLAAAQNIKKIALVLTRPSAPKRACGEQPLAIPKDPSTTAQQKTPPKNRRGLSAV